MAKKTKQDNPEMEQQAPVEQQAPETVQEQTPQMGEQQAPDEPICYIVTTNGRGLNLRDNPAGKVKAILPDGCTVFAEACTPYQEWIEVKAGDDLCGWVKNEFLRPVEGGEM